MRRDRKRSFLTTGNSCLILPNVHKSFSISVISNADRMFEKRCSTGFRYKRGGGGREATIMDVLSAFSSAY